MRLASCFRIGRTISSAAAVLAFLIAVGGIRDARAQQGSPQGGAEAGPAAAPNAAKPAVIPPKLVQFAEATYPQAALDQGLAAEVVLKLTIEKDGSVSEAEVLAPQGNGFDEAAREAALRFRFEPAMANGQPVRVQIQYAYRFTLKEVPNAAPPAPTTGELSGVLRLSGTDEPLTGVEVLVIGPDGTEQRVLTDPEGRFRVADAAAGTYRVRVAQSGFRELAADEQVAAGEATELVYRLTPDSTGLEIVVEGERPPREVTRRTIERREIERIPGTGGDALRALQSLPGVARPPGLAGFLIVRGSAPEDTNVFADGTLIPLIYHFGGLSSVFPTELLEQIDFYPSNFSARFGRVVGGVVDVGLRSPDTRCYEGYGRIGDRTGCYHGMVQVDLIDARLLLQGPIGSSDHWSFAIGARRSWIDAWLKPVLEESGASVSTAPVYYDYQAIVDYKKDTTRFSARFFGSDDRLEFIITDPFAQDPGFGGNLRFGTSFYRAQMLFEEQLSRNVTLGTMLSVGRDTADFSIGTYYFDLVLYPIYLRSEMGVQVANGIKANFGLDFLTQPYEVKVRFPNSPDDDDGGGGTISSEPTFEASDKSTLFRPGWYAELELQPTRRLRVVPGMRLDFARDSGHPDFSPRINARYDLFAGASADDRANGISRRRTTVKGGVGLYHQPPQPQETNVVFGTPDIKSNRGVQYALGIEQELTDQVELSVEGFYKDLVNLVARTPSGLEFANQGTGSIIGMETLLKYKPDERFFGWLAYTLSRSVRRDSPDEAENPFQYDQTHNLIVLGSYRLGRGWEFGSRFRLTSGFPVTPVVRPPDITSFVSLDTGANTPLRGKPYSDRLPLSHQLDIRIDKRWQFESWRLSAYLDVQNVYSHPAVEGYTYNFDFSQQAYQTGLPILPSIGVRGEF